MATAGTERAPLRVFRLWTLLLFRLIPARFALPVAAACLFWAVDAPAGFPLHLLGCLLLGMVVLPLVLAVLRQRRNRLQQEALLALSQNQEEFMEWPVTDPPRWQPGEKFARHGPSRCIKFPRCRHNQPATRSPGSLRSRLR
jgi:hypothetical protein